MTTSEIGLVPTDPAGLTPPWLTNLLRTNGYDAEVTSVRHEPVGSGQMAGSFRLHLAWSADSRWPDATAPPTTLVAKMAIGELAQREFAAGVFRNEVLFYQKLAPTLAVPAPRCHGAVITDDHTEFVLLLDDLAPAEQGDQIAGCTPVQARAVAIAAAGLHGPRWCDLSLLDVPGMALPSHDDRVLMDSIVGPMADTFRSRLDVSPQADATISWMERTAGEWLERPPSEFSLIHGDLRIDNVMFGPQESVTIVDWQTITPGHPLRDIAFLLATSLSVADRRAHERQIVADYHAALGRYGVTGYSLADCWRDYAGSLIQAPMIIVFGCAAAMPTERGDRMFQTMLERTAAAVGDLAPDVLE